LAYRNRKDVSTEQVGILAGSGTENNHSIPFSDKDGKHASKI
jgi:hypothetical protein